ncbi:MAG: NAD(P)-binding protein [Coriobacteriales bacterium]|jgi:Fe-S oxidoreductase|nr:NAD(P)-binding protein [Coriobacteriales bacterium]
MPVEKGIFARYERCLQDEPSACTARCPLHVDVAGLCAAVERGDFAEAFASLRKRVPLAGIICLICDHPCESVCVRSGLDAAVAIHQIERVAVLEGYKPYKRKFATARKAGKVAVIGAGPAGLACALELDRKGFAVQVFEALGRIGGRIWDHEDAVLTEQRIESELSLLTDLGIAISLRTAVDEGSLARLQTEYQAVFLSTGNWSQTLAANPETLQVAAGNLFIGGRLLADDISLSAVVASGKRAANSIERYIKKVSLTAEREREGIFATLLQYDMTGIAKAKPVVLGSTAATYSREQARLEAARCLRCECDACLRACPHLRSYGRRPKTYARELYTNLNVFLGTRYANKMTNSCTLCGLCQEVCPIDLGLAELVREARQTMVETEKMPPSAHDFALRDLEFSNGPHFWLAKPAPGAGETPHDATTAGGGLTADSSTDAELVQTSYVLFPGCQLAASSPQHVQSAFRWLQDVLPQGCGLLLGCCGAPADWAARGDIMAKAVEQLRTAWSHLGQPTLILACPSCGDVFARHLPEIPTISLYEMIAAALPGVHSETLHDGSGESQASHPALSIHDACTARHNLALQDSIRSISDQLGYTIEELRYAREQAKCCGYGGLVWYANPEQEQLFASDGAADSDQDLLVYCAMCQDLLTQAGKRSYHILDLLFAADAPNAATHRMPTLSERHLNRARLKTHMLAEFWSESDAGPLPGDSPFELEIPDEVQERMEQQLILREDIVDVLLAAASGVASCFRNTEDNSMIASLRKQNVTYWVRYAQLSDIYLIHCVYSHRMEILG